MTTRTGSKASNALWTLGSETSRYTTHQYLISRKTEQGRCYG